MSDTAVQESRTDGLRGAQFGVRWLIVAVAYYATAHLGLLIPYVGSHVSLVWLPTGVAVAAYLRWGGAMGTAILVSAFSVNVAIGGPPWMALGIAVGNALGPWLATVLLRRWSFDPTLTRRRDLGVYLVAVMVGMVVTASNGTTWLRVAGVLPTPQWTSAWMTWWTGDTVGALLGGIPLVAMTRVSLNETFTGLPGALNSALLGIVLLCGLLGFSPWTAPPPALLFPLLSLPLFVTAVLALRAGVLAASLAVLVLSATAAWGTANGVGPFAGHDTHAGLLALWSYITAQACTSVLICGLAAELLAARRQQAALFRHANEGILLVGPDGVMGDLNPSARDMLGVAHDAAQGARLMDLPYGNGPVLARWMGGNVVLGAAPQQHYLRLSRRDGAALEVEAQVAHHHDARGQLQTQLMLRDVTERRNAEMRLAASEERLRAITDNAPALIADHDVEMRYRFANRTYKDWLGLEPGAIIGRTVSEVLGEAAFAEVKPYVEAALRGESVTYDRCTTTATGERWLHVALVPRRGTDAVVRGYYVLASDITLRRQAEQALRQSEQRLQSITDRLPMRVSYVDKDERYRFVNLAYQRAFGRPREEIYGLTVREVIGDGAYTQAAPHIRQVLSGETVGFDSEMTTREGYRCYRATYVPQFADDGKAILGFVAIIVETTAQKLEERRLTELSQVDSLTGLLNRSGFERRLQEALERGKATSGLMALLFLDVDAFKAVNDSLGHLAGDMLLRGFAGRLVRTLRASDIVARPGGDEFTIIVEGLTKDRDAQTIAENILTAMQAPFVLEARTVAITTSIGVALCRGDAAISARALTKLADDQLYLAKAQGRNRFSIG
ncbi:MAG TPA: diguanylate cyclase [Methylibium sp.]|nr:diguanylate cyclase [Methylibium sp.]